jgi:hypothetical protein
LKNFKGLRVKFRVDDGSDEEINVRMEVFLDLGMDLN